jgi:hydrogenase maturation protease
MNGVPGQTLLIGVGNEFRNDDALGILVAREIRRRNVPGVQIVERSGEGTALMDAWAGAELVIVVDSIFSGKTPGVIHRLDAARDEIPRGFFHYSSHAFGVAEAVGMARELNVLPARVIIYGIEGKEFGEGIGLSDQVVKNIPQLIAMIEEDLHAVHAA